MTNTGKSSSPLGFRWPLGALIGLGAVACLVGAAVPAGASTAAGNDGRAARVQAGYQFAVPAVGLVKSATVQEYSTAGTPITYTYTVTNTGDATLSGVTVTDPMAGLSPVNCGSNTNVIPALAVGASQPCTATYTTTAADVAAGAISNTGTVTAGGPAGRVSYNSSLTIPEPGFPYTCKYPPEYFLSESQASSGPTTLFHSTTSPAIYAASPATPYPHAYNAIGFDPGPGPNEGYIFGMTRHSGQNELIKIDDTGAILGGYPAPVTAFPTAGPSPVVGAFDPSGNYWVTDGGGSSTAYEININGGGAPDLVNQVTMSPDSFMPDDWSWTAGYGAANGITGYPGFLWGLYGNQLYRVSATSGADGHWTVPGIPATPRVYGAGWTFSNGNLGFSNNATGQIYEISVGSPAAAAAATPSPSLAGAPYPGPQSNNVLNDGTDCIGQDTDLGVVSTGPATATAGSAITWNLTVTNNGPGDSSGFLVNDATKGATGGVTTSTPGCAVTHKGLDVQCAEGTLENGDSFTVTLSGTAPAAKKCALNTATVVGDEADPTPGNDTSTVKTCTVPPGADQ